MLLLCAFLSCLNLALHIIESDAVPYTFDVNLCDVNLCGGLATRKYNSWKVEGVQ